MWKTEKLQLMDRIWIQIKFYVLHKKTEVCFNKKQISVLKKFYIGWIVTICVSLRLWLIYKQIFSLSAIISDRTTAIIAISFHWVLYTFIVRMHNIGIIWARIMWTYIILIHMVRYLKCLLFYGLLLKIIIN